MEIENIFVMGAGVMGSGISQAAAEAGYKISMQDISDEFVRRGLDIIENGLSRKVKKATMTDGDKLNILNRISTTTSISDAKYADLVIEAIPEILDLKVKYFKELDNICPAHTILASNTSALPISVMAAATKRQPKVIGIHFMNPAPIMKGVELIRGLHTSDDTFRTCKNFIENLRKEPCEAIDYAGFIVSRILDAMMNEAFHCVMDGNRPEEVDKAMRVCCNFPMGPLELGDLAGLDIVLHGLETLHKEFGERLRPAPLLKSMVRAGELGRKTKHGFYSY